MVEKNMNEADPDSKLHRKHIVLLSRIIDETSIVRANEKLTHDTALLLLPNEKSYTQAWRPTERQHRPHNYLSEQSLRVLQ